MAERRKDSKNRVLKAGESERASGGYQYRWTTPEKKRKYIYAKTLKELRDKEAIIQQDLAEGIRFDSQKASVNDIYYIWLDLKKGLKKDTLSHYHYLYEHFVKPDFGKLKIKEVRRSDVRRFYNRLLDENHIKVSTIACIQTILIQVFDLAEEDNYIRSNPCSGVMKELKRTYDGLEKRKALTISQQDRFLTYLKTNKKYCHWYPIFAVMLGTGMRVGEVTSLRWDDVDFEKNIIKISHTLVYARKGLNTDKCHFVIHSPKTKSGFRTIPMFSSVKKAFQLEKNYQKSKGIECQSTIDGYTDFIFLNRFGSVHNAKHLNNALKRLVQDYNNETLDSLKNGEECILLPNFTCHILRHTFATRLCESGMNIKVIQEVLGHSDIQTTMDIYTDVTEDFKLEVFNGMDDFLINTSL